MMVVVNTNKHHITYYEADTVDIKGNEVTIARDTGEYYYYKFSEFDERLDKRYLVFYGCE